MGVRLRSGARVRCFWCGRTGRPSLHPIEDLLVLDLEFCIALGLFADLLPVGIESLFSFQIVDNPELV